MSETKKARAGLEPIRPLVAGVDIGSRQHFVACPPNEDGTKKVRSFDTTTDALRKLVDWLEAEGIESVAMESTGLYWLPLFEMLEARGIEAVLVNARDAHQLPGRPKTDVADCQWLQRLHSCGMLKASFRPMSAYGRIRTLQRQHANLVHERVRAIQWMQKSLDQMNVSIHHAVSDLSGTTGMAIVQAIVEGERDAHVLAALRDKRCKMTESEIAAHLVGTWHEEHLFTLASALRMYRFVEGEVALFEAEIARLFDALAAAERREQQPAPNPNTKKEKNMRSHGELPARDRLWRAAGVDLTCIDGISTEVAQVILAEVGTRLEAFPDERHFVSWLRLCPRTAISGGKTLKKRRNGMGANRVAGALRLAARALRRSPTALGAYFRSASRRQDASVAIFATARKLATLVFRMLRYGTKYVDEGERAFNERFEAQRMRSLESSARQRGFKLVPLAEPASAA